MQVKKHLLVNKKSQKMKNIVVSILLIVLSCASISAQLKSNFELKIYSKENNEALLGATVLIKELNIGSTSDIDGIIGFSNIPNGSYTIEVSYIGFQTVIDDIEIPIKSIPVYYLEENGEELEEVVLKTTRSTRTIQKTPTRVEFIGLEELEEKAVMNPTNISMVLRESTGIQMQQTSLSSGSMNIRIQGLDGRYTQLLRDGFPLYGGFSSGLSIMQIPPLDLQQFEIIKGSSSTLYGGGAISGLVNLISKTPEEDPNLELMLTQTQALGSTVNLFYSKRNEKFGASLYGSAHYQKIYDPENDDFSNLPKTKSLSFNPKFFFYPNENSTIQFGVNSTYDERIGGDVTRITSGRSGEHVFTESNVSKRFSSQLSFITELSATSSLELKNSVSFFDRSLALIDYEFNGKQINSFSEIRFNKTEEANEFVLGANLYTSSFDEINTVVDRDQDDVVFGVFSNSIFDISKNWIFEGGIRIDYSKDWGTFVLPKVSILYKNNLGFSTRLGGGLGYKTPDMFTEDAERLSYRGVLPISTNVLKAESSYGVNYDVNYKTRILDGAVGFSINQLFYLTAINNGLLLEGIGVIPGNYQFKNAEDSILSKGAETNIKFTYHDFKWFLNYALIDTRLNYLPTNPQKPLTAKHNAGSVIMYETEKWRIGYETYYTGKQLLSTNEESTDFVTMGFMLMRNYDQGSFFLNFENFTDQRQSKFSPLVSGSHESPQFSEIYAPTDGFIFSIGVIWKPFGNEHH